MVSGASLGVSSAHHYVLFKIKPKCGLNATVYFHKQLKYVDNQSRGELKSHDPVSHMTG